MKCKEVFPFFLKGLDASPTLLLVILAFVISIVNCKKIEPFEVRLYNKIHFEGRYIKLKVGEDNEPCINLPPTYEKKVGSVDPLGCVILYAEPDCKGLRRRLERWSYGSSALKSISFENMVSSISVCPTVKKILIPGYDDEL